MSSPFPGPSVAEERAEALRRLQPGIKVESPWRYNGTMLSIVFGVLAAIAVLALFGFFAIGSRHVSGWLTSALAIVTAEWMIRQLRFFGTGVEASLWLCGTFAFICGLPSQGKIEAILVFAAAAALSGWRVRNAFFGVLAAVLVVAYVAAKWEHDSLLTTAFASAIAVGAAIALRRLWQRPSTERLLAGLALVMPVAGYLASVAQRIFGTNYPTSYPVAAVILVTAVVLFAIGVTGKDRLLLVSAALSAALVAVEVGIPLAYTTEAKLITAGIIVAVIAAILARALRGATRGFVVAPSRVAAYDEAMQIGGIIAVAPHGAAPASHAHTGPDLADSSGPTDKSYGGGGAGGGF
jgi:MFS family permease